MRFPSLSLVVRAGMPRRQIGVLAAIGAASVLTACAWGDGPDRTGARMTDDSLLSYQVKAALDQDTALNTHQIRIHTTPVAAPRRAGGITSDRMASTSEPSTPPVSPANARANSSML